METCCIGTLLTISICMVVTQFFSKGEEVDGKVNKVTAITLPNEKCNIRPTLVNIGEKDDLYYPIVVSLHRCDGACDIDKFRVCKMNTSEYILIYFNFNFNIIL